MFLEWSLCAEKEFKVTLKIRSSECWKAAKGGDSYHPPSGRGRNWKQIKTILKIRSSECWKAAKGGEGYPPSGRGRKVSKSSKSQILLKSEKSKIKCKFWCCMSSSLLEDRWLMHCWIPCSSWMHIYIFLYKAGDSSCPPDVTSKQKLYTCTCTTSTLSMYRMWWDYSSLKLCLLHLAQLYSIHLL